MCFCKATSKAYVDMASLSPCANTEISMRGLLPAASSLLYFNILSAVICSPLLTLCVSLSLLTLLLNSPALKSPTSHLCNPTHRLLQPKPAPAVDEARPAWCASLWCAPAANPFLFIDQPFAVKTRMLQKAQGKFCIIEKQPMHIDVRAELIPWGGMFCWLIVSSVSAPWCFGLEIFLIKCVIIWLLLLSHRTNISCFFNILGTVASPASVHTVSVWVSDTHRTYSHLFTRWGERPSVPLAAGLCLLTHSRVSVGDVISSFGQVTSVLFILCCRTETMVALFS